ncbi:Creatine kinase M-type [Dissostichus eleginoides]|uniref:Creatine kinase M-type n=1 Tax=Dissostichus eleginoides TaxID=100907 RepID=A0AAD9B215_DISEL|nr:Creatine kinase M-type [Dissostichus eleginoides]
MHNQLKMKFSSEQEYPDLSQHNNHMAKVLTPDLYESLRDKETPAGTDPPPRPRPPTQVLTPNQTQTPNPGTDPHKPDPQNPEPCPARLLL